jgi:hypothetical protein
MDTVPLDQRVQALEDGIAEIRSMATECTDSLATLQQENADLRTGHRMIRCDGDRVPQIRRRDICVTPQPHARSRGVGRRFSLTGESWEGPR